MTTCSSPWNDISKIRFWGESDQKPKIQRQAFPKIRFLRAQRNTILFCFVDVSLKYYGETKRNEILQNLGFGTNERRYYAEARQSFCQFVSGKQISISPFYLAKICFGGTLLTLGFLLVSQEDHVNRYSVQAASFSFHLVIFEENKLCNINLSATFFRRNRSQLAISFQLIFISANFRFGEILGENPTKR